MAGTGHFGGIWRIDGRITERIAVAHGAETAADRLGVESTRKPKALRLAALPISQRQISNPAVAFAQGGRAPLFTHLGRGQPSVDIVGRTDRIP